MNKECSSSRVASILQSESCELLKILNNAVYNGSTTAMANPLIAFTLIKRLQSEGANLVYSNEASENTQALRSGFKALEASLPKMEDLQGAAKALMRLQDVYALQVGSLTRGRFQRAARGDPVDIYRPAAPAFTVHCP
ncbi:prolyl 4-hydroxylase subunit alpha-3-like [Gadus morhua]|uniref:prolyl 4-hydroxylase subunit alpha-3-like n=1 Tax=Gadus morhua TaxID=8049 RepID=UPI0011B4BD00|nr:prolyl 4-hydroxylase subunit alpha-3-like [Gadus morhua]